jgi:hypothetical protein
MKRRVQWRRSCFIDVHKSMQAKKMVNGKNVGARNELQIVYREERGKNAIKVGLSLSLRG